MEYVQILAEVSSSWWIYSKDNFLKSNLEFFIVKYGINAKIDWLSLY